MLCLVERSGTDIDDALANLQPWKDKVFQMLFRRAQRIESLIRDIDLCLSTTHPERRQQYEDPIVSP